MTTTFDILTLGEALICFTGEPGRLSASATLKKSMGGAESNVAIGLARLGTKVAFASRVGDDPFGDEILRTLRSEGVDVSNVGRSATRPTGLMVKEPRSPDAVHVYYYRSDSAATEMQSADFVEALQHSSHLHLSGITLAIGDASRSAAQELMLFARDNGIRVSLDPNFRTKLGDIEQQAGYVRDVLACVDDLLVSEQEAAHLSKREGPPAAIERLLEMGPSRVVVRLGEKGSTAGSRDGELCEVTAHHVGPVANTVGAGDAFTAGFLFEQQAGSDLRTSMETGSWVAAHVVTHAGDYEGAPFRNEYDAWRSGRGHEER